MKYPEILVLNFMVRITNYTAFKKTLVIEVGGTSSNI